MLMVLALILLTANYLLATLIISGPARNLAAGVSNSPLRWLCGELLVFSMLSAIFSINDMPL